MKDFQEILEQIAQEHGTTPEAVQQEMELALQMAYDSPSPEAKTLQNMISATENPLEPEAFVHHIASLFRQQ